MFLQRIVLVFCIFLIISLQTTVEADAKIGELGHQFSNPSGRICSSSCFIGRHAKQIARKSCRTDFKIKRCSRRFGLIKLRGFGCGCLQRPSLSPSPVPQNNSLFLVGGRNENESIISCTGSAVFMQVSDPASISVGFVVWSIPNATSGFCSNCGGIARRIVSVTPQSSFEGSACPPDATCLELSTTLATFSELFSSSVLEQFELTEAAYEPFEPVYGCNLSTRSRELKDIVSFHQILFLPLSSEGFLLVNPDGRCAFTDCFVGPGGNPADCFFCGTNCGNGCGPRGALGNVIPEKFPGLYDFSEPCGFHDNCYSSTFSKEVCDFTFLSDLTAECDASFPTRFATPIDRIGKGLCLIDAQLYYSAVARLGHGAYEDAQTSRKAHETTNKCIAECPIVQESGGQDTTTLTVDLMRSSGTFEVSYNMSRTSAGLEVFYEGNTIFSTGSIVSGLGKAPIAYSGNTTVVQVKISANLGTPWNVSVACPS